MKTPGWLAIATGLFTALVAYEGRTDLALLPQAREWSVTAADGDSAALAGVRIRIVLSLASPLPEQPETAVLLVRLALSGSQAARSAWGDCSVSLVAADGSRWRPMSGDGFYDAGRRMAPDRQNYLACTPAPFDPSPDGTEILSDQAYMVPVAMLDALSLRVSAQGTRPGALEFRIRPILNLGR